MNINLFQEHYFDSNSERQKELDYCYNINSSLNPKDIEFRFYSFSNRPTYNQVFEKFIDFPNDINIYCNSDVYFECESLEKIYNLYSNYKNKKQLILALAPWDVHENNNAHLRVRSDSQDTWVFYGSIPRLDGADFTGGLPGCENRMVAIFNRHGYIVKNPAYSIKTYHLHLSNVRHYKQSDRVHGEYGMANIITVDEILNSQYN